MVLVKSPHLRFPILQNKAIKTKFSKAKCKNLYQVPIEILPM